MIRLPRRLGRTRRIAQVLAELAGEDALSESLLQLPEQRRQIRRRLRVPDQGIQGARIERRDLLGFGHLPSSGEFGPPQNSVQARRPGSRSAISPMALHSAVAINTFVHRYCSGDRNESTRR